jgi:hypothetical protein
MFRQSIRPSVRLSVHLGNELIKSSRAIIRVSWLESPMFQGPSLSLPSAC